MILVRKSEFPRGADKFLKTLKRFAFALLVLFTTVPMTRDVTATSGGGIGRVVELRGGIRYRARATRPWRRLRRGRMIRHGTLLALEKGARLRILSLSGRMVVHKGPARIRLKLNRGTFTYNELALMKKRLRESGISATTAAARPGLREKPVIYFPRGVLRDGRVYMSWFVPRPLRALELRIKSGDRVLHRRGLNGHRDVRRHVLLPFLRRGESYRMEIALAREPGGKEVYFIHSDFKVSGTDELERLNRESERMKKITKDEYAWNFMRALLLHRAGMYYEALQALQRARLAERNEAEP